MQSSSLYSFNLLGFILQVQFTRIYLICVTCIQGTNVVNKAELELMAKHFPKSATFMRDVLPVKTQNSSVNVDLQIALRQIMDIVSIWRYI